MQTIETLAVTMEGDFNAAMYLRIGRLMTKILQLIQEAYSKKPSFNPNEPTTPGGFRASHGTSGATGGLHYEIEKAQGFIAATIAVAPSSNYLRNLEFGEQGAQGSPPGGAAYSRSKAPPIRNIYDWLKRANLEVPKYFKDRAEQMKKAIAGGKSKVDHTKPWYSDDENMQFAFAIAMKRKHYGRPAMRVIERTLRQYEKNIINYLQGATS